MYMYAQTKVLPCQKGKFEKQDCGLLWLYWNSLKSTAGAWRVNAVNANTLPDQMYHVSFGIISDASRKNQVSEAVML